MGTDSQTESEISTKLLSSEKQISLNIKFRQGGSKRLSKILKSNIDEIMKHFKKSKPV